MTELTIGVLSIQGDVAENIRSTEETLQKLNLTGNVIQVQTPQQAESLDALILPGGESTVIGQMSLENGVLQKIVEKIKQGMPVLGICAGLVLLSKNAEDKVLGKMEQPLLNLLDIQIQRNSFGHQRNSFESEIAVPKMNANNFNGVFIRAPSVIEHGPQVEILAKLNDRVVAVQQGNIIGTSFHPELTDDLRVHEYFIKMIQSN